MSNEINPVGSLGEAERLRQAADERASRWYSRYFSLAGLAMLAVFCIYALPSPWLWVAFAVAMAAALILFWLYERTQPIRRRASQRRLWAAFFSYLALVAALSATGTFVFGTPPTWWYLTTAVVVATPFFLAAALERRHIKPTPGMP